MVYVIQLASRIRTERVTAVPISVEKLRKITVNQLGSPDFNFVFPCITV